MKEDINRLPKASAHHGNPAAVSSFPQRELEGRMAVEAIVLWLCGAGVLGGLAIRLVSELYGAGVF